MSKAWFNAVVQSLHRAHGQGVELRTDAELLEGFLLSKDQTAFEVLVWRHGAMVMGVCRRVLGNRHEAEDAFQATFLVFVKKAHSIGRRGSVAAWLYKVAYRIACRVRSQVSLRPMVSLASDVPAPESRHDLDQREVGAVLDEEIQRLPANYRVPLILHLLQERTCREAARELGWPLGTLATRLRRGKTLLRERLGQRGVVYPAGLATGVGMAGTGTSAPNELIFATVRNALAYVAGKSAASAQVIALSEGVLGVMNMRQRVAAIGLLLAALTAVGSAWGLRAGTAGEQPAPARELGQQERKAVGDWPMFGGSPARNMVNLAARNIPVEADDVTGKNIKWRAETGKRGAAGGPVVAGGRVFVGANNGDPRDPAVTDDRGVMMCFDERTGKFVWQATHARLGAGQIHDWPQHGIDSTPTVENGLLYYLSNRCTLVCARAAGNAGKPAFVWELDLIKELGVFPHNKCPSSPLVVGDLVFVITSNGVDEAHTKVPRPDAPSFVAVNKRTGKVAWKDNSPGKAILHTQWSSPAYGVIAGKPQVLFPGGDGWLRAFEPATGTLLWKFDCNPKDARHALGGKGTRSEIVGAPVVADDRVYIAVGQDPEHGDGVGHLWCIEPGKPKLIPADRDISDEIVTDSTKFPPATKSNPSSGMVWHYGGVDARPNANPQFVVFGRSVSTCAVHDGLVYAAETSGYLHCVDARTGQRQWVCDLKSSVHGSPLWVDGKVYIGTDDGDVWIFKHGRQKIEAGRMSFGGPIRSAPVVANGVLYVMTDSTLFAVAAK